MIFIRLWGAVGASIATVIAEFTVTGVQFYMVRKEISFLKIIKLMRNYVIASIIMLVMSLIAGKIITNNIISIMIQILIAGAIYFILLFILKDKMINDGIELIRLKLKTKSNI